MWDRCRDYLSCGIPRKLMNALAVLVIGLGLLLLVLPLTGAYSWQWGVVGLVTAWVIGGAVRVYLVTPGE